MARVAGTFPYAANLELTKKAPLDAKMLVQYKSDLTNADTWTADDGLQYTYPGMIVSVAFDALPDNNGVYRLIYDDYSNIENWELINKKVTEFSIQGINPRGYYNDAADPADVYMKGDLVRIVDGDMYFCLLDNTTAIKPTVTAGWETNWVLFSLKGAEGKKGDTPYISFGADGKRTWWIAGVDTGVVAEGKDGAPGAIPTINPTTNTWWIGGVDTEKQAIGKDGKEYIPTISQDGYWVINGEKTSYKAIGQDGEAAIANIRLRGDYDTFSTYNNNVGGLTDVVYGSDGNMYYCRQNGTMGINPVTDTAHTHWYFYSQQGRQGNPAPQVMAQYSETGLEDTWHTIPTNYDVFVRFSYDGGIIWTTVLKFQGPQGSIGEANLSDISSPIGSVIMWAGIITEMPIGYLLCDGSTILKAEYPELVRSRTGSETQESAVLPDLRSRFIVGYDDGSDDYNLIGKTGGLESVRLTAAESGVNEHTHIVDIRQGDTGSGKRGIDSEEVANGTPYRSNVGITKSASKNADIAHENRPPYYVLAYIIKANYKGELRTPYDTYLSTVPEGQTPLTKVGWLESMRGETGTTGINPRGYYSDNELYIENDTVVINNELNPLNGNSYVCYANNVTLVEPGITENWQNYWYPFVMRGAPGPAAPQVLIRYSALPTVVEGSDWHAIPTLQDVYARFSTDGGTTFGTPIRFKGDAGYEIQIQYSENGTDNWHTDAILTDQYVRFSTDNGATWGNSIQYGGSGSSIISTDIPVKFSDSNRYLGKYKSGTTILSTGWTVEQLIKDIALESIAPNATISASGSIPYNTPTATINLTLSSSSNNTDATITGFIISYQRGNGVWVEIYNGEAKTSHAHSLTGITASEVFTWRLQVTDSIGATKTINSGSISPAGYAAPTYSVTTPFSTTREMGDLSTAIVGTISQTAQNGVSIVSRTLQYSANGGAWTDITTFAGNTINYTHNNAALKDSTSIAYRIVVITTSATTNITTNLTLGTVSLSLKKFFGTKTTDLTGAGFRTLTAVNDSVTSHVWNANGLGLYHYVCVPVAKSMTNAVTSNFENITANFGVTTVNIPDAGGFDRSYKVYKLVTGVNYNVTITATTN